MKKLLAALAYLAAIVFIGVPMTLLCLVSAVAVPYSIIWSAVLVFKLISKTIKVLLS